MGFSIIFCLLCCLVVYSGAARLNRGENKANTGEIHSRNIETGWPGYLYTRAEGRCTPQLVIFLLFVNKFSSFFLDNSLW
jgi:hypothetical protein